MSKFLKLEGGYMNLDHIRSVKKEPDGLMLCFSNGDTANMNNFDPNHKKDIQILTRHLEYVSSYYKEESDGKARNEQAPSPDIKQP